MVIDFGIKAFLLRQQRNTVCKSQRYLERSMRKTHSEQRKTSRKQKNSHKTAESADQGARVHEKITNQRTTSCRNSLTMLIRENQTICIEDLNVKE